MSKRFKLGSKHIIIPDTQCKPGVDLMHLAWIGDYIADKRPDVIVHLGDHWDMPSLSSFDKGKLKFQGRRYNEDIEAGNHAMQLFWAPLRKLWDRQRANKKKLYNPRFVFLMGNHEERIETAIQGSPEMLEGTIGFNDLDLAGWEVHTFLHPVEINGVQYAHYFYNPMSGHPWGGMTSTMLKNIGFSFTMGHRQGKNQAERHLADGTVQRGLVVGSYYSHDEEYKGPQANYHWRGIIVKHEVRDGNYDLMEVSLDFLRTRYERKRELDNV